jgi:hypothetical protein
MISFARFLAIRSSLQLSQRMLSSSSFSQYMLS